MRVSFYTGLAVTFMSVECGNAVVIQSDLELLDEQLNQIDSWVSSPGAWSLAELDIEAESDKSDKDDDDGEKKKKLGGK